MLNYLWGGMLLAGMLWGALNGTWNEVTQALLDSAKESVSLGLTMLGILSFWCGIMEIGTRAGLVGWLAGRMTLSLILFPELGRISGQGTHCGEHHCEYAGAWHGGNACGIKSNAEMAKDIQAAGDKARTATSSMCTFLILNISSLQLISVTLIAYRSEYVKAAGGGADRHWLQQFLRAAVVFCKMMDWKNRRLLIYDSVVFQMLLPLVISYVIAFGLISRSPDIR